MFVLALGLVLMLGVHVFASLRGPRGRSGRADRRRPLPGSPLAGRRARPGADRLGLHPLPRRCLGPDLGAARTRARRHMDADVVRPGFARLRVRQGPGKIRGWLRHPLLASVTLWSLAHLVSNGDAGGMLLFGAFFVWSIYARFALERRGDHGAAPWPPSPGPTRSNSSSARSCGRRSPCSTPISPAWPRSTVRAGFPLSRRERFGYSIGAVPPPASLRATAKQSRLERQPQSPSLDCFPPDLTGVAMTAGGALSFDRENLRCPTRRACAFSSSAPAASSGGRSSPNSSSATTSSPPARSRAQSASTSPTRQHRRRPRRRPGRSTPSSAPPAASISRRSLIAPAPLRNRPTASA